MDDITRERVWRKLQVLPDAQLFQVLDFIEFLEGKYAAGQAAAPSGLQRFAERLQDRLRGRSVAPEYISGAVGMLGMARKVVETGRDVVSGVVQTGLGVVDEVMEAGRDFLAEPPPAHPGEASLPPGVKLEGGTPVLARGGDTGAASSSAPAAIPPGAAAPASPVESSPAAEPLAPPAPPLGRDAAGEESPGG